MHYVMSPELKLLLKQYLAQRVFNTTSLYLSTWFFFLFLQLAVSNAGGN